MSFPFWGRHIVFFQYTWPSKVCMCNSFYILNGNSSKLCILAYYLMKNRILFRHDIAEILLKVVLNTITLTPRAIFEVVIAPWFFT